MMLMIHIVISLTSLLVSGWVAFRPTLMRIRSSYTLIALTLGTGTFLVVQHPAHLGSACLSGIVFLGLSTVGVVSARRNLSTDI